MNGVSLQAAKIQLSNNGGNNPNFKRTEVKSCNITTKLLRKKV